MSRPVCRRLVFLLAVIGSCQMEPAGSVGCDFGPMVSCGAGDYGGDADGGESGPPDEMSCWQACEGRGPGWGGRMEWTGTELTCECRWVGFVPCDDDDCAATCASLGYEYRLCDFAGCRCFHVPAPDVDADADGSLDVEAGEADAETDGDEFPNDDGSGGDGEDAADEPSGDVP